MNLEAVLEGLLFVVGEDGLTLEQMQEILELDVEEVKKILSNLRKEYERDQRGIRIHFLGNTFKLTTKEEHRNYYQRLIEHPGTGALSQSALETLAIIAYNEPITRLKIDEIRGVSSIQLIRKLVAKDLIKEAGRSELPGRPILYRTTNTFLDYFGLSSIDDLPEFRDFIDPVSVDDTDLYHSKYQEDIQNENEVK